VLIVTVAPTVTRGRIRIEPSPKRVRAQIGGVIVADSRQALLVWEKPYYPTYYFPVEDVRGDLLVAESAVTHSPSRGDGARYTVAAGGRAATGAAVRYADSPIPELRDLIRLDWASMDHWFEEDEEVYTHPRDPYTRVDVLASSRRVQVEVDGELVADSTSPHLLFETGLPTRYYLPKTHVRMDLLRPTDTATECPYKGTAEYWSIAVNGTVHADLAWSYRAPFAESQKIAGLIAFYNEKLDLIVDGVRLERPHTKFS
jgi:uncharacterized protein (DUF427 family)